MKLFQFLHSPIRKILKRIQSFAFTLLLAYMLGIQKAYREEETVMDSVVWRVPDPDPNSERDHTFIFAWLQEYAPRPQEISITRM